MNPAARAALRAAAVLVPLIILFGLYWPGLQAWFCQDDFAWLSQVNEVQSWRDLPHVLFTPRAQGTIRPWSERAFFLLFRWWFDLDAFPYRLWVYLTMAANLLLLVSITRRLTRSEWAALAAPVVWIANIGLATPLSWTSTYNQILCAFFFLTAFRLLLAAVETGRRGYWWAQAAVFALGFGALEINVVYPALACAYCWFCARDWLRRSLWLFAPSVIFTAVHRSLAPRQDTGPYAMHWDGSIFVTLQAYAEKAMAAGLTHPRLRLGPDAWWYAALVLLGVAAAYVGWCAWRRRWLPVFGLFWFLAVLAPILPLRDHFTDYYLTIPAVGLAWIGAAAVQEAETRGWRFRSATCAALGLYLLFSLGGTRFAIRWQYERAKPVQRLVEGVRRAAELNPGKTILLANVSSGLFWGGVYDHPFRLIGVHDLYLVPDNEAVIEKHPELGDITQYFLPREVAARALAHGAAVVYALEGERLRNVTRHYRYLATEVWKSSLPKHVDAGSRLTEDLLGEGWYALEGAHRWMAQSAEFTIAGPTGTREKLFLSGYCPAEQLSRGPLYLSIQFNGVAADRVLVQPRGGDFGAEVAIPSQWQAAKRLKVRLEVNRTFRPAQDARDLGLAFGTFTIR